MKEFNSSIAFILFLINLIGSLGILIAGFFYPDCPFYTKTKENDFSSNLQINLIININGNTNNLEENFKNLTYFEKYKETKLAQNEEEDSTITKELNIGIYINFLTIYICMYLCVSFFIKEIDCPKCNCAKFFENLEEHNKPLFYICFPFFSIYYCCNIFSNFCSNCCGEFCECCRKCCSDCKDKNFHCNCEIRSHNGGEGECILVLFILGLLVAAALIAGFFYFIYFLTNLLGKNITRYVSFFIISILNIIILILAFLVIDEKENSIYVVLGSSGLIIISNIIGIVVNNFCCDSSNEPLKEYKYEPTNIVTPTPDNLDYNLEAETNRDPINETPSNDGKTPMIEYQTYSSKDNISKTVY